MGVEVNYLAVLLAAVSSMVVESIWYAPKVFGNVWIKLTGRTMKQVEQEDSGPAKYLYVFIASLFTAYVLAHVTFLSNQFFDNDFLSASVSTAFWVWLGFTAARMFTHDIFENRRKKLTILNLAHELVTLLVMGLIIGLMGA